MTSEENEQWNEAVTKAAFGWLIIKTYSLGPIEEIEEDCQTVAALLGSRFPEKPAAAAYTEIQKEFYNLPKPQILQLLTLMEQ